MLSTTTLPAIKRKEFAFTGKFPSETKACSLLDKFEGQENAGETTKQMLKKDERLEKLREEFSLFSTVKPSSVDNLYEHCLVRTKSHACKSKDIELFSVALSQFQNTPNFSLRAGIFLSALINNSKGREFIIITKHISPSILAIGKQNTKNITIDGDTSSFIGGGMKKGKITINGNVCGDGLGILMNGGTIIVNGCCETDVGSKMKRGQIIVNGAVGLFLGNEMQGGTITIRRDAGHEAGYRMEGGLIIIEGNAANNVGDNMKGGQIIINGNVGFNLGEEMRGGTISIDGNIGSLSKVIKGGNIFQRGRQIVKDGKQIAEIQNE
jgi:hypothetical protein